MVEISDNYVALKDRNLSASQMTFHGIKLGDPASEALALPNAYPTHTHLVCVDAWHVAYLIDDDGTVAEINFWDPKLTKFMDLHEPDDIQMRLGKADSADADTHNSGEYVYYNRHLRVMCDAPEKGSTTLWVSITLVR